MTLLLERSGTGYADGQLCPTGVRAGKVSALWSGKPISVRLDDLDKICAALGCTVADLLGSCPVSQD
jgi:DNA-binding Xre family transcriptional regulator